MIFSVGGERNAAKYYVKLVIFSRLLGLSTLYGSGWAEVWMGVYMFCKKSAKKGVFALFVHVRLLI